jgi:NAD(P)-dependent dehydrogenase (short-subunit alcohol dehydrogenase family)
MARPTRGVRSRVGHAIISGGSSGIGLALGRRLAAAGWNLTILARDADRLAEARAALAASGAEVMAESGDVADRDAVGRAVHASVARLGPPKLVVASAGMVVPGRFDELPLEAYRKTMEVNYFGTLNLVRAALPAMRAQRGGRIVMISSGAALLGIYTATLPMRPRSSRCADSQRRCAASWRRTGLACRWSTRPTPILLNSARRCASVLKQRAGSPAAADCAARIRSPRRFCAGFAAAGSPSLLDWRCRRWPCCTASSARCCIASGSIARSRDSIDLRQRSPASIGLPRKMLARASQEPMRNDRHACALRIQRVNFRACPES